MENKEIKKIYIQWFLFNFLMSFVGAIIDCIIWLPSDLGGFPIFSFLSLIIGNILGLVYIIIKALLSKVKHNDYNKNTSVQILLIIIHLFFPILNLISSMIGFFIGYPLVKLFFIIFK